MPKSRKMLFRGASIRKFQILSENKVAIARVTFQSDITTDIAEQMKWEIYHADGYSLIDGLKKSTPLKGSLMLKELSFKINGAGQAPVEVVASSADDFKLVRKKTGGDEEDEVETSLRFVIESTAWDLLAATFANYGDADGALNVTMEVSEEAQPKLVDQPKLRRVEEEEKPDKPAKGKSKEPSLASKKTVMEKIQ